MSNLILGDCVFYFNQCGWGFGKVFNVSFDSIDVFFVGIGVKCFLKLFVQFEIVEGVVVKYCFLDNLIEIL